MTHLILDTLRYYVQVIKPSAQNICTYLIFYVESLNISIFQEQNNRRESSCHRQYEFGYDRGSFSVSNTVDTAAEQNRTFVSTL